MKKITQEEFDEVVRKHQLWINNEKGGERADLSYTDLRKVCKRDSKGRPNPPYAGLDLKWANLRFSNLSGCSLVNFNFTLATFDGADLSDTRLYYTNFSNAHLAGVKWDGADFRYSPIFCGAYCTRIYQISLGMLGHRPNQELLCNNFLTLYDGGEDNKKYFVDGFRGSYSELMKQIKRKTTFGEQEDALRFAVDSITKLAKINRKWIEELEHNWNVLLDRKRFLEKYPDTDNIKEI